MVGLVQMKCVCGFSLLLSRFFLFFPLFLFFRYFFFYKFQVSTMLHQFSQFLQMADICAFPNEEIYCFRGRDRRVDLKIFPFMSFLSKYSILVLKIGRQVRERGGGNGGMGHIFFDGPSQRRGIREDF